MQLQLARCFVQTRFQSCRHLYHTNIRRVCGGSKAFQAMVGDCVHSSIHSRLDYSTESTTVYDDHTAQDHEDFVSKRSNGYCLLCWLACDIMYRVQNLHAEQKHHVTEYTSLALNGAPNTTVYWAEATRSSEEHMYVCTYVCTVFTFNRLHVQ